MSEELKPCPFCESRSEHYSFNYRTHTVRCVYCLADCGEHDTPERAAFVWNSRPNEFVKDKEIERLKAENERLKEALKKIDDLTFMPRHKDEALDRAWHITRAALIPTNAPDMDDGRKTEINGKERVRWE